MADLEVMCRKCGAVVSHECNQTLSDAFMSFMRWHVEYHSEAFSKDNPSYSEGDEKAPFLSEGYLYPLLGKEDARTLLALFRNIVQAAGFDLFELRRKIAEDERLGRDKYAARDERADQTYEVEWRWPQTRLKLPRELLDALDKMQEQPGVLSRSSVVVDALRKHLGIEDPEEKFDAEEACHRR